MSNNQDPTDWFDENLRDAGGRVTIPDGPTDDLRRRCLAEFALPTRADRRPVWRGPAILSTIGLAALLALFVGLLFPTNGLPRVEAATILAKLHDQIEQPQRISIRLESLEIDEVSVDGWMEVADQAVAGDLKVSVVEGENGEAISVDLAMAISKDQSWVLIRRLEIPEPDVQPILNFMFPAGSETLLVLPKDIVEDDILDELNMVKEIGGFEVGGLVEAFQELIQNQPDSGATITEQADGTILMSLSITDEAALNGLVEAAMQIANKSGNVEGDEGDGEIDISLDSDSDLIGSTLSIVYDPESEQVRSFSITDFGTGHGTISIDIGGGPIDPALLDADRVTTPATRTLDLNALGGIFESLGAQLNK